MQISLREAAVRDDERFIIGQRVLVETLDEGAANVAGALQRLEHVVAFHPAGDIRLAAVVAGMAAGDER